MSVNSDITLYAQWKFASSITYNANYLYDGYGASFVDYGVNNNFTIYDNNANPRFYNADPSKRIVRWNTDPHGNGASLPPNFVLPNFNGVITLYATWEKIPY